MKKLLYLFIIIIVILLLVIAYLLGNKNTTYQNNSVGKAGISIEEFNQITNGMSESTVYDIIDLDGLLDDDTLYDKCVQKVSDTKDEHVYTYTYRYQGEISGYAEITYTADYSNNDLFVMPTVSSKQNFNLK